MNKILVLVATGALALVGCKSGTITGKALDPFTGKPLENATVWLKGTPLQTKSAADGAFKFEEVDIADYDLSAGKNKYSETVEQISITETALAVDRNVYLYSREDYKPGLYQPGTDSATKLPNQWLNWEVACKQPDILGYRIKFTDSKKAVLELPAPQKLASSFSVLYYNASSSPQPIEAQVYSASKEDVANHPGCVAGFGKDEKQGVFPKAASGTKVESKLVSANLFQLTGTLPAGPAMLVLSQDGKVLKSYYFTAK